MAKKKAKAEDAAVGNSTQKSADSFKKDTISKYGKNSVMSGIDYCNRKIMKIPFSPALDLILHGGIDEGSFVGLAGNEDTGKTVTALSFAATCQRPEYGSRKVYYGRVEGRLDMKHLAAIRGLDLANLEILGSTEGRIWTAQDHLKVWYDLLKNNRGCVLLIDSISSMVDEKTVLGGVGTETRGGCARLFSQWLDLVKDIVDVNRHIVVGITHLISNTGGGNIKFMEKAARNWAYMCNYRLRTTYAEDILVGKAKAQIGLKTHWVCSSANGTGKTTGKAQSIIRYGVGVDWTAEIAQIGLDVGLIKKVGTSGWKEMIYLSKSVPDYAADPIKVLGDEGIYRYFKEYPEHLDLLNAEIRLLYGTDVVEELVEDEVVET